MRRSLVDQGILDDDQLLLLEHARSSVTRDLAKDILADFISISASVIRGIEESLNEQPLDEGKIQRRVSAFSQSAATAGAAKITTELEGMAGYCNQKAWGSLKARLEVLKELNESFRTEILAYLALLNWLSNAKATNGHAGDD